MQIRIANRQDEKNIRELKESLSNGIDLKGADSDLVNIEANYFGKNGLFLVVEENGAIVGFGGAKAKDEQVLSIKRMIVSDIEEKEKAEREMLRVIVDFAPRMLFKSIECDTLVDANLLSSFDFAEGKTIIRSVNPDF